MADSAGQLPVFCETALEALDYTVKACGGYKAVGAAMRGDKAPDQAGQWLRDCMNANKPEKLGPDQVDQLLAYGRERGVHVYMQYLAARHGYAAPIALTSEDKAAVQTAAVLRVAKQISLALGELTSLGVDVNALIATQGPAK